MKLQSAGQIALVVAACAYLLSVYLMSSPVWIGFTI